MSYKAGYMTAGSGEPVVLLHCSMSSKEQWFKLFNNLKDNFKVIAVDLYGYGESPFPEKPEDFTLKNEIELMESVLEKTIGKHAEFHLVGHSYGGAVAMNYSAGTSGKTKSLTVFEPMLNHVPRETDPDFYQLVKAFIGDIEKDITEGRIDLACSKFIDFFSGKGTFERLPDEIRNSFRKWIRKMPLDYRATIDEGLSLSDYKSINIPVCLIAGTKSPGLTKDISEALSKIIKNLEYHKIDSGHMGPIENSNKVNSIIVNFIEKF